ncbi:BglG family transcription antiterminator [Abiotrophia defectiva]|uniref:Ascorbate-specific PTS system EIIA component n=1 Tax=Abiotrophia defectiva ATCC 49176 TaxID=592010 RepID=W1Q1K4_ABIDE|nr:BglG family transcription antiterminator [Abiotrophia defectiva]ESK64881.1 phosphoenolpyruvate-dependent sugar phosphotransferase system, EIIA 2 [Abiotrophia defectiva ATCC 49176]QKH47122.1 BglG family transcription antiterminator [Abiotrophia defectiva]
MFTNELIKKYQFFLNYTNSSIGELENLSNSSRRTILSDILKINEALSHLLLPTIRIENDLIRVPAISSKELLGHVDISRSYTFQHERLDMIVLYLVLYPDYISNYHLQDLLRMSKNSVVADLKDIREFLKNQSISLQYTRSEGYYLEGTGSQLRQLLERTIEKLMRLESGRFILDYVLKECRIATKDAAIFSHIRTLSEKYQLTFIFENVKIVSLVMAILNEIEIEGDYQVKQEDYRNIKATALLKLVEELEEEYPKLTKERDYILSRLAGCLQGNLDLNPDPTVVQIMDEIIKQVKANTGLEFPMGIHFRKNLFAHLYPSYYRLLFNISLHNPLTHQIKREYRSLYELIRRSLKPLEEMTGKPLSSDEIAYFTIHFGGYLQAKVKRREAKDLRAMIVCPNGVSTSLILQSELEKIFPRMEFQAISRSHFKTVDNMERDDVQVIFSTTHLESQDKVFLVKPLMTSIEKILLKRRVYEYLHLEKEDVVSIDELMGIVAKYTTIKNEEGLKNELIHYLFAQNNQQLLGGDSLTDLLKEELIQQVDSMSTWQDAVGLAAQPLLAHGYIEESYIQAMIASINETGPYIVLAPKVAVPHASPDAGVHQLGISLLQVKEPVDFSEDDDDDKKVQLIFVLAAVDSTAHLRALQELALILDDEEAIDSLIAASDPREILAIIEKIIEEGGE